MNKSELIKVFGERFNTPDNEAADFINIFFERIRWALREGERVEIRGFGTFSVREYGGYAGRNPRSGEPVEVHPKRLPFFKPGKQVKDYININD